MKKFVLILAFFFAILCNIQVFAAVTPPTFTSKSVAVTSSSTSQVLYSVDADEHFQLGALAQVMTAIVALDKLDSEQTVTVPNDINTYIQQGDSIVNIKAGETFAVKNLVTAMIVGNGDDAAIALAIAVSGDIDDFVALMNTKATQLGLQNTHFTSPKSVDDTNQYSTANDMAAIAREAYSKPTLKTALTSKTFVLPATGQSAARPLRTNNYLFDNYIQTQYYDNTVVGGKTGYLGTSVCNAIEFAKQGDSEIISVVMGGTKVNNTISSLVDAKTSLAFAFSNFSLNKFISQDQILTDVKLTNVKNRDNLNLSADFPVYVFTENGATDTPEDTITLKSKKVKAPIKAGDTYGQALVTYQGKTVATVPLVSQENIDPSTGGAIGNAISWFFSSWIFKIIIILVVLYVGYIFLYARPKKARELRRLRRKQMIEERLRDKNRD